jgi:hypothetical protein
MGMNKEEIITFKADAALAEALSLVPNRSDFIRSAILNAMMNVCPLCQGTGILTPQQKKHWEEFSRHHELKRCSECKEVVLTCDLDTTAPDA